jgi:hypothetical protein
MWETGIAKEGNGWHLPMLRPQLAAAKEWEESMSCEKCKGKRAKSCKSQKIKGVKESEKML